MPNDVQVHQLIIYVGTQAQIQAEKDAGRITDNDFVVVTDAAPYALNADLVAEIAARTEADNGLQTQINTKVSDVLMAGTSIVASNVARIPLATADNVGVVKVTGWSGLSIQNNTGVIFTNPATVEEIAEKTDANKPITPLTLDDAVKAGIVDNYYTLTSTEKANALNWLGAATTAQGVLANTALQPADIIDNLTSTATNKALSANMGRVLQEQILSRGRFLSIWNCTTGLPESNPEESPYTYKAGDYYFVGTVGTTNYRPTGSSYISGVASTVVETAAVAKDDIYIYDGTNWLLLYNTEKTVRFVNIAGDPYDNTNLATALNAKADDSDVAHLDGAETFTGVKTFEQTLQLRQNLSFRSYGSNNSGRLQFRAQPDDNVIRGTVAITDGYSTTGSGYTGFVAQMVARAGSTTSEPFNTMRVSNKGIEYIKEANDGTVTGQYIVVDENGMVPSDRLASSGSTGQFLVKAATGQSWASLSSNDITTALGYTPPTINSTTNYVPYKSGASAFNDSTLLYNSNAMAFTGRLHIGSSSPNTYYNKGRLTLYDNTPSQQVSSIALLNYGGGGGCGVAIDMYNTSANGGIPSGRFGVVDNGNYSGYLQLQVKKSGSQSNPLLPAMNIVPVPASNSLTTCVSFGQDEFNRVLFDLHKPEATTTITDSDKRWSGSGTTYSVTGNNKFNLRLLVGVGDIVYFTAGTEATVTSVVSTTSQFTITTDKTLGSVSNQSITVRKAYFKITDESNNTKVYVNPDGKMGLNTLLPEYTLDVNGTINASTDVKVNGNSVLTNAATFYWGE